MSASREAVHTFALSHNGNICKGGNFLVKWLNVLFICKMLNKIWQEARKKGNVTVVLQKVKRETKYNSEEAGEKQHE